jgi:hypothetical protein
VVGGWGRLATFFASLGDSLNSTVLLTLTPIFTIRVRGSKEIAEFGGHKGGEDYVAGSRRVSSK